MTNPFSPPLSEVRDVAKTPGSAVKAVVVGLVVDIVGSMAAGTILTIGYGAFLSAAGASADEVTAALTNPPVDSGLSIAGFIIGTLFSGLGGYVCARIAKHAEYRLGLILAAISATFGLLVGGTYYSAVVNAVLAAMAVAAVLIGVRLGVAKNASS